MIKSSSVVFVSEKLEKSFKSLSSEDSLKKHIYRAIEDLKMNAFTGIQVPKRLIPKEYVNRYGVSNLWKYDLPEGWRLIYTITRESEVRLLSIILDFFNPKDYAKLFGYKK
jgi:Txe/YoeB family toxin of Txe-Axe toxin-antitoxin module